MTDAAALGGARSVLSAAAGGHGHDPASRQVRATRMAGFAGLLSFDLIVIATFVAPPLWDAPGTGSPVRVVATYARANATRITTSLFLYSVAMALFLCLVGGLWDRFRRHESAPPVLASALALAGCALTVLILAGFVPTDLLAYRNEPASIAGLLADSTFGLLALSGIPTAVFLGSFAALVLRVGGLPKWTAYLAVLGAAAHLLIAACFLSHSPFLSLESKVIVWVPATFFVWILATGVALLWPGPAVRGPAAAT